MIQSKKYPSGISSQQSIDIITKKMQHIHLGQTSKVKPKVQNSFQNNSKMKIEDRCSVEIRTKVQMPSINFQTSVRISKEKTEMIQHSNSSGHTSRSVGRQLMLPSKETSKGQGQNTRPVRKSSNHHSGSCHTTRTSTTKSSTREEQKSTETRKHYYRKP